MWFFTLIYVAIVGLVNNAGLYLSINGTSRVASSGVRQLVAPQVLLETVR